MQLKDVLEKKGKDVHTISSNSSADDVVMELVRFNIGSLLVQDSPGGPILGIITERDILQWRRTGLGSSSCRSERACPVI